MSRVRTNSETCERLMKMKGHRLLLRSVASAFLGLLSAIAAAYYGERIIQTAASRSTASDQTESGWTKLTWDQRTFLASRSAHLDSGLDLSFAEARAVRRRFLAADWKPAPPALQPWGGPAERYLVMFEYGWPAPLTWGVIAFGTGMPTSAEIGVARVASGPASHRLLPVIPSGPGVILDTLFWGAPWWLAFLGVHRLRIALRVRAGCCRHCRYDLVGTPSGAPCPECGRPSAATETMVTGTLSS